MWNANTTANDSAAGGYLNTTSTMNTTENEAPVRRIQNIMPLVVRQIKNCQSDDFKLFGYPAQIIKLVGIIKSIDVQSTKANYKIEDRSGEIKAILWLETDGENPTNLPSVKEGSYAEVYGSLRNQDNEKMVMILRMFPVSDNNIITTHLLKVIYTRLSAEAESKKMISDIKQNNPGAALANSMNFMDYDSSNAAPVSGLTQFQSKVFRILQTDQSPNGMSKSVLYSHFTPNQHRQVLETIQFLSNEGHVYSTTDDEHFKATEVAI